MVIFILVNGRIVRSVDKATTTKKKLKYIKKIKLRSLSMSDRYETKE